MAKRRYFFNSETLSFEALPTSSLKTKFLRVLVFFVLSLVLSLGYEYAYSRFFDTPKSIRLKKRQSELMLKYEILQKQVLQANHQLNEVHLRDNNMYRAVLGLPNNSFAIRDFSNISLYSQLEDVDKTGLVVTTSKQMDWLLKKAYFQSKSFDDVAALAINMEEMAECVPAIQPVDLRFIRSIGGYGWRTDPVYGDTRHHDGLDFAGNLGTSIYATGDGKVVNVEREYYGYGNMVEISHGFGYTTRYAHLQVALVRPGQKIKRGDKIALLGNTGKSTGPHLHYEVRYMGRPLDPRNFFSTDLSSREFNSMVRAMDNY